MTQYRNIKVGDKINICVSIRDFCGSETIGLTFNHNDINLSPSLCKVTPIPGTCLIVKGIGIRVRFAESSGVARCNKCTPTRNFPDIATLRTNENGTASVQYTVTQSDLDNYNSVKKSGGIFKLVTCISDPLKQKVIKLGECSEALTVSPKACIPVWVCETPRNGYEKDGCGNRRLNTACADTEMRGMYLVKIKYFEMPWVKNSAEKITNGIKHIWNTHASELAGWEIREVSTNTATKEIVMKIEKTGSITYVALIGVLTVIFIMNPAVGLLFVGLGLLGLGIYNLSIMYLVEPAFKEGFKLGFDDAKIQLKRIIDADPELSTDDKDRVKKAIDDIQPDPDDIDKSWEKYKEKTFGIIADAITIPIIIAPAFVMVDNEFDIKGVCDPNYVVTIYRDDQFSIWDVFKGDPLKFLDDKLGVTKSGADGKYLIKLILDKQDAHRIYAKTGGKESKRSKIYALTEITIVMIVVTVSIIGYLIYIRKRRKK